MQLNCLQLFPLRPKASGNKHSSWKGSAMVLEVAVRAKLKAETRVHNSLVSIRAKAKRDDAKGGSRSTVPWSV